MSNKTIIKSSFDQHEIWCYGEIREDSNFSVVCQDEDNDRIVPGLEDDDGEPPTTWKQVISLLESGYWKIEGMQQVSAC